MAKVVKKKFVFFRLLVILFIPFVPFVTAYFLINEPLVYNKMFDLLSSVSKRTITVDNFRFSLFAGIDINGLGLIQKSTNNTIHIDKTKIKFLPFKLLQGRLGVDVHVNNLKIDFVAKSPAQSKKRFDFKRLILLRRLVVDDLFVDNAVVNLIGGSSLQIKDVELGLAPVTYTKTALTLRANDVNYIKNQNVLLMSKSITLVSQTNLSTWGYDFPYFGDLKGKTTVDSFKYEDFLVDNFRATVEHSSNHILIDPLIVVFGESEISAEIKYNLNNGEYRGRIDMPDEIYFPYIVKDSINFETEGRLSGKIDFNGFFVNKDENSGSANIDVKYDFACDSEYPAIYKGSVNIKNGLITIPDTEIVAGESRAKTNGIVDFKNKNFLINLSGEKFPVESFFRKLKIPSLTRLYGPTDFEGTFKGWGYDYKIDIAGKSLNPGWIPLSAKEVDTTFSATYNSIDLNFKLLDGNLNYGDAVLNIKLGKLLEDETREKEYYLDAKLYDYPLENSLQDFGIEGTANVMLKMSGKEENLKGSGSFDVNNARIWKFPVNNLTGDVDLAWRKVKFSNVKLQSILNDEFIESEDSLNINISDSFVSIASASFLGWNVNTQYDFANEKWAFKQIEYANDDNNLKIAGDITKNVIYGDVSGDFPAVWLSVFGEPFLFFEGRVDSKLKVTGTKEQPFVSGKLKLDNVSWYSKDYGINLEGVDSNIILNNSDINISDMSGEWGDGRFSLSGKMTHKNFDLSYIDLELAGNSVPVNLMDGNLKLDTDLNIRVKGNKNEPLIRGDIVILDGRYTKDFNIFDSMVTPAKSSQIKSEFRPKLDLSVRNSGDFIVKNNVGDIWLNADITIKGDTEKLQPSGTVSVAEGKIKYLGFNFEIQRGFVELRSPFDVPYLEILADREMDIYTIQLTLFGRTDNLAIELSATSPTGILSKRDALALLFTGQPTMTNSSLSLERSLTGAVVGGGITQVVSGPVTGLTGLDVFRLETTVPEDGETPNGSKSLTVSKVTVGKRLSDRFEMNLSMDISSGEAIPLVTADYNLTDNILLRFTRGSLEKYMIETGLIFRFR